MINDYHQRNLLSLPITAVGDSDYPGIQYADDTMMVFPACPAQTVTMKNILIDYTASVGPNIDFQKSILYQLVCSQKQCSSRDLSMLCQIHALHVPQPADGTTRLSMADLMPMEWSGAQALFLLINALSGEHCHQGFCNTLISSGVDVSGQRKPNRGTSTAHWLPGSLSAARKTGDVWLFWISNFKIRAFS